VILDAQRHLYFGEKLFLTLFNSFLSLLRNFHCIEEIFLFCYLTMKEIRKYFVNILNIKQKLICTVLLKRYWINKNLIYQSLFCSNIIYLAELLQLKVHLFSVQPLPPRFIKKNISLKKFYWYSIKSWYKFWASDTSLIIKIMYLAMQPKKINNYYSFKLGHCYSDYWYVLKVFLWIFYITLASYIIKNN